MAGASLIALLDDMAALTKVAAAKTSGVVGDDLALNAKQLHGITADRELPVVYAVAKGSAKNKAIIVPASLLLSAVAPWSIMPILALGGAYLCHEGGEKIFHVIGGKIDQWRGKSHPDDETPDWEHAPLDKEGNIDLVALEKDKITGAIRTDFILSAEIIIIALGTVAAAPLMTQAAVLGAISVAMTVGVYGAVAGIVKMDDVGEWMEKKGIPGGSLLVKAMPKLMKGLTIAGTAAMFTVGGGILAHNIPALHGVADGALGMLVDAAVGLGAGALTVSAVHVWDKVKGVFGFSKKAESSGERDETKDEIGMKRESESDLSRSPSPSLSDKPAISPKSEARRVESEMQHGNLANIISDEQKPESGNSLKR